MAEIVNAVQSGSFPASEKLLSQELIHNNVASFLEEIRFTKTELGKALGSTCEQLGQDVGDWIVQAKKVQNDIAQCKEDYHDILDKYAQIERLGSTNDELRSNARLLEVEVSFNENLQKYISLLSEISEIFARIDTDIRELRLLSAAQQLSSCVANIDLVPSDRYRHILLQTHTCQAQALITVLQSSLAALCSVKSTQDAVELYIRSESDHDGRSSAPESLNEILESAQLIGALDELCNQFASNVSTTFGHYLHRNSKTHPIDSRATDVSMTFTLSTGPVSVADQLRIVQDLFQFLHIKLPEAMRTQVLNHIADALLPRLRSDWLDACIPVDLDDLHGFTSTREAYRDFAKWLGQAKISQATELEQSLAQVPQIWVSKRRATSLNSIRKALRTATCTTRQVQRTETRSIKLDQDAAANVNDEWDQDWDEDNHESTSRQQDHHMAQEDHDDSDAWGFGDEQEKDNRAPAGDTHSPKADTEESDAWGWGDEEESATQHQIDTQLASTLNGKSTSQTKAQAVTLTEDYVITDIPDHVLEQTGRDLADAQALRTEGKTLFSTSAVPIEGLDALPTLILAFFRATAVDHYASASALCRMNLYNDALYLVQKLSETPQGSSQTDIAAMSKFARSVYSTELSTQRTVLLDLSDNAQGFVSCTVEPYHSQCESAVSSITDYIRALHSQWAGILSTSHLAQSIGSLISSVMSKMIKEIEDMEDIQESESRQLLQLMERLSALEDLFKAANTSHSSEQEIQTTIALHASAYLRFQYLQQILDGSLADIKYLWTEGELSLEFEQDEVVDLIKALFAESSHRRSAIQAIKAARCCLRHCSCSCWTQQRPAQPC